MFGKPEKTMQWIECITMSNNLWLEHLGTRAMRFIYLNLDAADTAMLSLIDAWSLFLLLSRL